MINGNKCFFFFFFARIIRKIPYVLTLLPLHQWKKVTVDLARDITRKFKNLKLFVRADRNERAYTHSNQIQFRCY